jgi:hypothetical protein
MRIKNRRKGGAPKRVFADHWRNFPCHQHKQLKAVLSSKVLPYKLTTLPVVKQFLVFLITCKFVITQAHHKIWPNTSFRSPSLFYLLTIGVEVVYCHLITLRHTPQSVGPLWTRDRPVALTSTWQHKHCTRDKHQCRPVGFEPTIPASARPQTYALDRTATGLTQHIICPIYLSCRHTYAGQIRELNRYESISRTSWSWAINRHNTQGN